MVISWKKKSGKDTSMEIEGEERRIKLGCSSRLSNGGMCIRKEVWNMGTNEWWQRGMAHHGRGMETHTLGETHTIGRTLGEEKDGMESLREGFGEYKEKCEQNRKLLKGRYEERKTRETEHGGRYAEMKRQFEENKQRLKGRYEERKSRKEVKQDG